MAKFDDNRSKFIAKFNESMTVAKGDPGEDGKSAYEIAVENGFVGTEEEWLESLKGEGGGNANVLTINVHLNPDRLVLDKSLDEIVAAHNAGYAIRAVYSDDVFSLTRARVYESGAWFIFATSDDTTRRILHISSSDDPQINSNVIVGLDNLPTHLPNPMPLVITGSTNAMYNGDSGVFMRVADNWDDLLNKPFGVVGTEGAILDNYLALFNDESIAECIDIRLYLEDGVNYTVTFGSISYTDTAKALTIEGASLVYMGNPSVVGAGEDNGLPYMVASVAVDGNYAVAFYLNGAANSEVLVTVEAVPTLRKLDAQYLPTMTATEIGGAKVGEGLEVVDEKLGVKQEVLDKIESLSKEIVDLNEAAVKSVNGVKPDENGDVQVQGGGSEGVYELIEEITIDTDDVREIFRTQNPDGTPYNYSKILVKVKNPPCEVATNQLTVKVTVTGGIAFDIPIVANANYNTFGTLVLENRNGRFFADVAVSISYATNANIQHYRPPAMLGYCTGRTIKDLNLRSYWVNFVNGIKIEIWGVRADA